MDQKLESKAVVNEHDAAAYVGLAVQSLRNRRFRGEQPPFFKIGRSVRYRIEDLEEFLMSHRVDPGTA
jgi:hypothetical protein